MARTALRVGEVRFMRIGAAVCAVLLASVFLTYHTVFGKRAERSEHTGAVELAAHALSATGFDASRLHHVGTPVTFQMHLGTFRPWLSQAAFREITSTGAAHYLAVDREPPWLQEELSGFVVERVFRWPEDEADRRVVEVLKINR